MAAKNRKLFFLSFALSAVLSGTALWLVVHGAPTQAASSASVNVNANVAAVCGNNIREGSEVCDGSASSGVCYNLSCNEDCTCPVCGDGTIGAGEDCESNSDCSAGKTCNASCKCQGIGSPICTISCGAWGPCVDGIQTRTCTNSCGGSTTQTQSCAPVCGNGSIETGEECDDGNVVSGDGCSSSCQLELGCGNGTLDANEECDDNNTVSGDCCSSSCEIELLISNVSVSPITETAATVNWQTRSCQGRSCQLVGTSSVL